MCLSKDQAVDDLVRWGSWHWANSGYGENIGYSSDGCCEEVHLKTAACGGGNKTEHFEDMSAGVAYTDAMLSKLDIGHYDLCRLMFLTNFDMTIKQRVSFAKPYYLKKYKINSRKFESVMIAYWSAVRVVLDKPKLSEYHPVYSINDKKIALQHVL